EAGQAVALLARDHLQDVPQLPVGEVGLVAAQVEVDAGGAGDRPADPVGVHGLGGEHAHVAGAAPEDLVAEHQVVEAPHARADVGDGGTRARGPAGREVLLEAAHPVEHVVHPPAGDLLHDVLEFLPLPERVEDRGDAAELQRIGAEEHQVVEHPVQFGEQRAQPHGALGDLHAEHALHGEDHTQLVGECRQPVVPVGEHDDLAVVPRLEQLLRAPVHVADHRLRAGDEFAVQHQLQAQHAVRRRMLRADVQHHVGALRCAADTDHGLRGGRHGLSLPYVRWPHGDGEPSRAANYRHVGRHAHGHARRHGHAHGHGHGYGRARGPARGHRGPRGTRPGRRRDGRRGGRCGRRDDDCHGRHGRHNRHGRPGRHCDPRRRARDRRRRGRAGVDRPATRAVAGAAAVAGGVAGAADPGHRTRAGHPGRARLGRLRGAAAGPDDLGLGDAGTQLALLAVRRALRRPADQPGRAVAAGDGGALRPDAAGRGHLRPPGTALRPRQRPAPHRRRGDRRDHPRPRPRRGGTAARPAHRAGRGTIGGAVTAPGVQQDVTARPPVIERRLHPVTPLRRAWAPVAVLIGWALHDPDQAQRQLARLTTTTLVLGLAVLLPAAALYGFLTWWFTHFAVTDTELRIRTGLLFRRTAHIRLERVQAIDVTQPLLARIVGVAKLKLDVIGTDKKDELAFLGAEEARALRAELLARAAGFAPETAHEVGEAPSRELLRVPPGVLAVSLVLTGATWGWLVAGLVVVPLLW